MNPIFPLTPNIMANTFIIGKGQIRGLSQMLAGKEEGCELDLPTCVETHGKGRTTLTNLHQGQMQPCAARAVHLQERWTQSSAGRWAWSLSLIMNRVVDTITKAPFCSIYYKQKRKIQKGGNIMSRLCQRWEGSSSAMFSNINSSPGCSPLWASIIQRLKQNPGNQQVFISFPLLREFSELSEPSWCIHSLFFN